MTLWKIVGWIGNAFYFSRFLHQWVRSERAGRSVTPVVFWWLSLGGCLLLGSYALHRGQVLLLPAFLVNGAVYVRNLHLAATGGKGGRVGPVPAALIGLGAAVALYLTGVAEPREGFGASGAWLAVGIGGQLVWSSRFLLQWWFAEHTGRAEFPASFWWYTLAGSLLNIAYTAHLGDPIFLASYAPTPLYPIRNLMLERKAARRARESA